MDLSESLVPVKARYDPEWDGGMCATRRPASHTRRESYSRGGCPPRQCGSKPTPNGEVPSDRNDSYNGRMVRPLVLIMAASAVVVASSVLGQTPQPFPRPGTTPQPTRPAPPP